MRLKSYYPVVLSNQVAGTADFYRNHFGFETVFEADWYVSLRHSAHQGTVYELAILEFGHTTIPTSYRHSVNGLILNFEVEDVDAEYERLIRQSGLPLELELRNEAFGQRHFMTRDPNGVLIDVIKVIPPTEAFSDQYLEQPWNEE